MAITHTLTCPYCLADVKDVAVSRCPRCGAEHHNDCWSANGGCAVHGCTGADSATEAEADNEAPADSAPEDPSGIPAPRPASATESDEPSGQTGPDTAAAAESRAPSGGLGGYPHPPQQPYVPVPVPATEAQPTAGGRTKRKVGLVVGGVALAAAVGAGTLAATGQLPLSFASHEMTVSLSLYDPPEYYMYLPDTPGLSSSCYTTGGYSDIGSGMTFDVLNEKNEIIGTGRYGPGDYEGLYTCTWEATVTDLPKAEIYKIDSGRRGSQTYTYEEMVAQDWEVSLSIG